MRTFELDCVNCGARALLPLHAASVHTACKACGSAVRLDAFPALFRETAPGRGGEDLLVEDESSCFYHPAKRAVVSCAGCGRFLCSLCDVDMNGRHLCPRCIEAGVDKGSLERLRKDYTYYDEIALALAIIPILMFWVTLVTAPIALYIAIRYWHAPVSAVPRGKWRYVTAIVIAGVELVAWGIVGAILFGL